MLLLRGDLRGDPTVRELIGRERDLVLSAYDHQEMPYGLLARELARPDAGPLFAATFSHDTVPPAETFAGVLPGLRAEPVEVPGAVTQHDLNVKVLSQGEAMTVHVAYAEGVFDPAVVRRLAEDYVACLDAATADPDRRITGLLPGSPPEIAAPAGPAPAADTAVLAWSTAPDDAGAGPATELESLVADLWADLLDTTVPGVHANLFELGGHSLTVATLAYRIEESFGLPVTIADLMEHPTVAGQARLIEEQLTARLAALTDDERERLFDETAAETHQ
jgi:non-ribosomal peptide synthetase component F